MKLVILESPYAGDIFRNIQYARRCVRDSLLRGEAPIASHLLYTQDGILKDDIPEERRLGIDAGLAWKTVAEASVVYADFGITKGMQYGIDQAEKQGLEVEIRYLFNDVKNIKPKKKITIKQYGERSIHPDTEEGNKILDIMEGYLVDQCKQIKRDKL